MWFVSTSDSGHMRALNLNNCFNPDSLSASLLSHPHILALAAQRRARRQHPQTQLESLVQMDATMELKKGRGRGLGLITQLCAFSPPSCCGQNQIDTKKVFQDCCNTGHKYRPTPMLQGSSKKKRPELRQVVHMSKRGGGATVVCVLHLL